MDDIIEFEKSQSEIDDIYNTDYFLNVELPQILKENEGVKKNEN